MNETDVISQLEPLLAKWLPAQRWFSSGETTPSSVSVSDKDVIVTEPSTLLWMIVRIDDDAAYQVPVGIGTEDVVGSVLYGQDQFVIGRVDVDGVEHMAYDALIDPSLSMPLFDIVVDKTIDARSVRPMGAEQSNTSLVYDNRYVVKYFRRLSEGSNPDLEVTQALTDAEFPSVARVLGTWQRGRYDLAVAQPFLWDGTDGWKLALASARDFFGPDTSGNATNLGALSTRNEETDPSQAGGDFASEARRLGVATAELHLALAQQFPKDPFDVEVLAASLASSSGDVNESQRPALDALIAEVRSIPASEAGFATRVHGDYHLGQTLRSVNGWYIFDFEGEPLKPLSERTKPASPFKDVAGMLRSFHYAAASAVFEQMESDQQGLQEKADAWEQRNRNAFRDGYLSVDGVDGILPTTNNQARSILLKAFEVEKAIYELAYERAHRPTWIQIPQTAIDRLLA